MARRVPRAQLEVLAQLADAGVALFAGVRQMPRPKNLAPALPDLLLGDLLLVWGLRGAYSSAIPPGVLFEHTSNVWGAHGAQGVVDGGKARRQARRPRGHPRLSKTTYLPAKSQNEQVTGVYLDIIWCQRPGAMRQLV